MEANLKNIYEIQIEYAGLGDYLFFSPLPRLLKNADPNSKVFVVLSKKPRSQEVLDIVWRLNPYVDGVLFGKASKCKLEPIELSGQENILSKNAKLFGLSVTDELSPEIYVNLPDELHAEHGKIVVDLNYKSFVGAINLGKILKDIKIEFQKDEIILVNSKAMNSYQTTSFIDYIHLIRDAKKFVCLTSGGATLAAALNKNSICYYGFGQKKIFHHHSGHEYRKSSYGLIVDLPLTFLLKTRNKFRELINVK